MRIATYQKSYSRGGSPRSAVIVLRLSRDEMTRVADKVGPGPYSLFYDRGLVVLQSVPRGVDGAVVPFPHQNEFVIQQNQLMSEHTPKEPFGSVYIPDGKIALDKGMAIIDLAGLVLPPVRARTRKKHKVTPQIKALNYEGTIMKTINGEATEITAPLVNGKLLRKVMSTLEDVFDEQKGIYITGWSDERVAKECMASFDFVVKTRRDSFGEIKEDPKIAELRRDILALREAKLVSDNNFNKRLEALEARLQNLELAPKFK